MSDAAPLLQLSGFGAQRAGDVLFAGLDFSVEAGQCWALSGPNGSGKTTLLRSVAGLFADYDGVLECTGSAYLGHKAGIPRLLPIVEGLRWYQRLLGSRQDLSALLRSVGLAGYEHVAANELSAGQLRRAALARLQLQDAPVWLLDEPYTALDPQGQALVDELIRQHCSKGGAVVAATHQPLAVAPHDPLQTQVIEGSMRLERLLLNV
ncbi:MAG: heme ABC exporter ATP-binding protein CcmA [Pseudomonadales bacterium]